MKDEKLVTLAEFAKAVGVGDRAVRKAAALGRIAVYDTRGAKVAPGSRLRFVRLGEAIGQFQTIRCRIDGAALLKLAASEGPVRAQAQALIDARAKKAEVESQLLELRLARRRGELVSRPATIAAFEALGRAIRRGHTSMVLWAEEICAASQSGGVPAVSGLLKAKSLELGNAFADLIEVMARTVKAEGVGEGSDGADAHLIGGDGAEPSHDIDNKIVAGERDCAALQYARMRIERHRSMGGEFSTRAINLSAPPSSEKAPVLWRNFTYFAKRG